jgi:hypothetical protein
MDEDEAGQKWAAIKALRAALVDSGFVCFRSDHSDYQDDLTVEVLELVRKLEGIGYEIRRKEQPGP